MLGVRRTTITLLAHSLLSSGTIKYRTCQHRDRQSRRPGGSGMRLLPSATTASGEPSAARADQPRAGLW
jgi:hypothetical protein